MSIYEFLKPETAAHCQKIGRTFTAIEMAALVYHSDKTLEEKHNAYKQIIAMYPDTPFPGSFLKRFSLQLTMLHKVLESLIIFEDKAISDFYTQSQKAFYHPEFLVQAGGDILTDIGQYGIYSTIEKAREIFSTIDYDLFDVERIVISKVYPDSEHSESISFNRQGEILFISEEFFKICSHDESSFHDFYFETLQNLWEQAPDFDCLTDQAFRNAVFPLIADNDMKNFDCGSLEELELTNPNSLDDLLYFTKLKRLTIIQSSDNLKLSVLTDFCWKNSYCRGYLQEIIVRKEIKKGDDVG